MKGRIALLSFCALSFFMMVAMQRAEAQQLLYGSVAGTVTDQSGAVVPGAAVKITNIETGFTRQISTNASGQYSITSLPEGDYRLNISASGFKPLSIPGIHVIIGQINEQDAKMTVGSVTQQVTVRAGAGMLETQQSNVHTALSGTAIEALPLNVYHSFQAAAVLAPGVFSDSGITNNYPNSIGDTPDRSFAINTNGLPQHMNINRVDGATDIFVWLSDHMVIVPPTASIQEVNVQTSNYSVEKGPGAAGGTDIITKSGTNQFHGSGYLFHTDNALNAQNTFVHVSHEPKDIRNNVGATIGGPIIRNKVFFFFNWDGYFQRQSAATRHLIPTQNMRNGDFSSFLGDPLFDANGSPVTVCTTDGGTTQLRQGMIFDPTTGNFATGQGRCAFTNNIIPDGRMYQGAINFWKLMDPYQPNSAQGPFTTSTAVNDTRLRSAVWNRNIYTSRVDYDLNSQWRIWGRYALQKAFYSDGNDYGVAGIGGGVGVAPSTVNQTSIGYSWTVSPNLVSTGVIGFTYMKDADTPNDFGKPLGQDVLGLVNSNTPAGDVRQTGMPQITMDGLDDLGNSAAFYPLFRNDWTATLDSNNTWIHGSHQVSFGANIVRHHMNEWQPSLICCPRGGVTAGQFGTFLNLAPGDGTGSVPALVTASGAAADFQPAPWNSVALFDMGLANVVGNANQFIKMTFKEWQIGFYVGDDWRITPRLTMNVGTRYETYPIPTRDGLIKQWVYDPASNELLLGGLGGNDILLGNTPLGFRRSNTLFAPRFGLAYKLDSKTVVRSAFGITYDSMPLSRPQFKYYPLVIGSEQMVTGNSRVTRFIPYANFNKSTNAVNDLTTFADGVPLVMAPSGLEQGAITVPVDIPINNLQPGLFHKAYAEQWNVTVQRELPYSAFLTVGYVGNHLVHEYNSRDINAAPLGGGFAGQPLSKFGRFAATLQGQGYLDSHYNSLQVSVRRPASHGLFLQASYTYSKVIGYEDDQGGDTKSTSLVFNCPPSPALPQGCLPLNRHTLAFDHTHVLKLGAEYTLPFGPRKMFASQNPIARNLLGGWKINTIFSAWTGDPLILTTGSSFLNTPGSRQVPDLVGNLKIIGDKGPGQFYFDPTAFRPVETERFGTFGQSSSALRGPGLAQLDFSLFRTIKLGERLDLRISAEAQNLTNTPHFNDPGTNCKDSNGTCAGSFGQITSGFGERILQFGAKFVF